MMYVKTVDFNIKNYKAIAPGYITRTYKNTLATIHEGWVNYIRFK